MHLFEVKLQIFSVVVFVTLTFTDDLTKNVKKLSSFVCFSHDK